MEKSQTIPSYLNNEFFIEALDETGSKNVVIHDLKITRNTTGGNYCSDIYIVEVKYESNGTERVANLLVKDLFENLTASSREYLFYTEVLPVMNSILTEASIERPVLSPKMYLARKIKGETHVFENMNAIGYKVCDRFVGFNLNQTRMVMEKLANFHAASIIYKQKHPKVVDHQLQNYFWENNDQFPVFRELVVDGNINYITDIISKWTGYEEIAKKMLRNSGNEFDRKFLALFKKEDAKVRVIAHADLWIKNILILEEENEEPEVLDVAFIDHQICFEGSPALDILNFLITSVQLEVLQTQRESLIEYYHKVLYSTLNKCEALSFGIEVPSLDQIKAEIARYEYFTYYALVFAFTQTNLSEELSQDMDYEHFFETTRLGRNRENMFSNPRVLETLKFELKRLDQLGIFE